MPNVDGQWVIYLLAANAAISLLFLIFAKPYAKPMFLMFIFIPVLGFGLYVVPILTGKFFEKSRTYDRTQIIMEMGEQHFVKKPNVEEEINVISFDAAMSISDIRERRSLLLSIIKNDRLKSSSVVKAALSDSDPETSHYAAAATLENSKKLRAGIGELELRMLTEDSDGLRRELITAIDEYLQSGILMGRDFAIYADKYVKLMEDAEESGSEILTCEDYLHKTDYFLKKNNTHKALENAKYTKDRFANESSFLKLLEVLFLIKNERLFNETFEEFKKSAVAMSSKGVELVRFWAARCE